MSDTSQAPGWWQASDGKWYAPQLQAAATPVAPSQAQHIPPTWEIQPNTSAGSDKTPKKPWWRRWWAIALAVFVVIAGIINVASPKEDTEGTLGADTQQPAVSNATMDPTGAAAEEQPSAPIASVPGTETVVAAVPAPTAPAVAGTREVPLAIGSPAVITLDTFGDADGSTWALSVDAPGGDITAAVLEENQFNEPPADGKLFYGVPVTLTLQGAEKEPLSPLFNISLDYYGPSTLEIIAAGFNESCGVVANELDSMKEVFVGGSISGFMCYSVTAADAEAGILVSVDNVEGGRVFLATR